MILMEEDDGVVSTPEVPSMESNLIPQLSEATLADGGDLIWGHANIELVTFDKLNPHTSKLHTNRHGPYRVVNHIGTVYTLENLVTNKLRDYHVKLLFVTHLMCVSALQQKVVAKKGDFSNKNWRKYER